MYRNIHFFYSFIHVYLYSLLLLTKKMFKMTKFIVIIITSWENYINVDEINKKRVSINANNVLYVYLNMNAMKRERERRNISSCKA